MSDNRFKNMRMEDAEHLGEVIGIWRCRYDLSQKQFGKKVHLSRETISRIENGHTEVSIERYYKIMSHFEKSNFKKTGYFLDERFGWEELYKAVQNVASRIFQRD